MRIIICTRIAQRCRTHQLHHSSSSSSMMLIALVVLLLGCSSCSAFVPVQRKQQRPVSLSAAKKRSSTSTSNNRQNRVQSLTDWAETAGIQIADALQLTASDTSGLGWWSTKDIKSNSVLLQVPAATALTVVCPGDGPSDPGVSQLLQDPKSIRDLPWFVQFSLYLHKLDKVDTTTAAANDYRPWLDSLPRKFDTPIHWSDSQKEELQYPYLSKQVTRQDSVWRAFHAKMNIETLTWDDFCWGCECARSRAFSGGYNGSAFNPALSAFTLLLITVYVGLGLGTLEQAANGAGVVVSVAILKDFVVPKLLKKKAYVICPVIDMANHVSVGAKAKVSFEYFANAYSLAVGEDVAAREQVFLSYGSRSNDQLLQYYGFVEKENPSDVYVLPPLREWSIQALEDATGRTFAAGRLQKLDRAGLLGGSAPETVSEKDTVGDGVSPLQEAANLDGGVVVTSVAGVDPAVLQALRALVSTDQEWLDSGEAVGNFSEEMSGGAENERCARLAAKTAIEMELANKPTTVQEDEELLGRMETIKSLDAGPEERLAVQFRIEKKKLLLATIDKLQ